MLTIASPPPLVHPQIRGRSTQWEGTVSSVAADGSAIFLSAPLPFDVVEDTYEYCLRLNPLLLYRSTAEGFWPVMATSASGPTPDTLTRFRALGWLMGASLVNRTQFPFTFSRALMTQLWPSSAPRGGEFLPSEFDVVSLDEVMHQVGRGEG